MHKTAGVDYSNRCSTCLISISGHPAERARYRQMDSFEKQSQVDELFKKELIVAIFCNRDHLHCPDDLVNYIIETLDTVNSQGQVDIQHNATTTALNFLLSDQGLLKLLGKFGLSCIPN